MFAIKVMRFNINTLTCMQVLYEFRLSIDVYNNDNVQAW